MLTEMCQWIFEAWQSVLQAMIERSFKVSGMCNKMDRSEDNFLWHWPSEESCQKDTSDGEEDWIMN
jgi:hypothetical protein